jgi:Protein of unknown function (DUF2950)
MALKSQEIVKFAMKIGASNMNSRTRKTLKSHLGTGLLLLAGFSGLSACGDSQKPQATTQNAAQSTFRTPEEAGKALAAAAKTNDAAALSQVLGAKAKAILTTGDAAEDKAANESFAAKYDKMNRWIAMTDGSKMLYIGADNYAFPIPVAKDSSAKWYFNSAAGAEEIKARDIGRNELLAIDAVNALGNAQEIYFRRAHDGGGAHQYAQRIISSAGKQDGLYWEVPKGQDSSPLGHLSEFPKGSMDSVPPNEPPVIDGYTLRILTAQGDKAKGGAKSYIANGKMTGGFAVLATPVKYGDTGIMTFILSREGVVYENDLGKDTSTLASAINEYNPTDGWTPVE